MTRPGRELRRCGRLTAPGPDLSHATAARQGQTGAGYQGTLRRLDATSGATVATITMPAGRDVVSASVDPAGRYLYVSAWSGSSGWVSEYTASTGRLLASTALSSVGGSALTAVPGGVWASFRTGMNGRTVLLRQRGLRQVTPPASIFVWPMDATTVYGGSRVWLAGEPGAVGCITPGTSQVAGQGRVPLLDFTPWLLAVNPSRQLLYAQDGLAIIEITPHARAGADRRSCEFRRADHPGMRRNLLSPPRVGSRAERRRCVRHPVG